MSAGELRLSASAPLARSVRRLAWAALLLVLFVASGAASEASLTDLVSSRGLDDALTLAKGLLRPDFSQDFLLRVLGLTVESIAIGALGMLMAWLIGVPFALVAARLPELRDPPGRSFERVAGAGALRWSARLVLSILRSIPEIVWAFLFVRVFGLGPGAAVFAIGLSSGGIVGKLYAELLESCHPGPVRALRASGVSWLGVLLYGLWPQVRKQWLGYGLFRFECAIRSGAILGIVGAGGLGGEIELSIRYFQYDKLATVLLALLTVVAAMEIISATVRRRGGWRPFAMLAVGSGLGFAALDVDWAALWTHDAVRQLHTFVRGFASPNISRSFLGDAVSSMLQTVAMAACATMGAAVIALFVAPLASRVLTVGGYLNSPPPERGLERHGWRALWALSRLMLQLARSLPELVWALLFVVWVGPGPFAGVLAIGAHSVGVLGRLFGEVYEDCEPEVPRGLEAAGCGRFARWLYGVLPQTAPRLLAFGFFRFEVNIRATAMVGFVGAGGIGDSIHTAVSLFHMDDLASLLLVLLAAVVAIDFVGHRARRGLLQS